MLEGATSDSPSDDIAAAVSARLRRTPAIDGMICASAACAFTAVVAAEDEGRTLGQDIDVAAKEAIPILRSFRKEIIVVSEDVAQAGAFLARAIMQAIDEPGLPPLQNLDHP